MSKVRSDVLKSVKGHWQAVRMGRGRAALVLLLALSLLALLALCAPPRTTLASNPGAGTLGPTVGASLSWSGTATGGVAANGEADCAEGSNCDSFTLTVSGTQADWAGKQVSFELKWLAPASDFDMYIYKGSFSGPQVNKSTGSPPGTSEAANIDPYTMGTGTYVVRVVYFSATAADQYNGTATVVAGTDPVPTPTTTPAPTPQPTPLSTKPVTVGDKGNEPIVLGAPDGTLYISALQHIYRSTNAGASWTKLPGPIYASQLNLNSDSSISVDPGGRLYFTFDYPYAGTTAVCTSDDRGDNWTCNPATVPGGTDRMWVLAPAENEAYEVTNEGLYETTFLKSGDRGLTWLPSQFGQGLLEPQTGPLFKKPGSANVLQVTKGERMSFYVYSPNELGTVFSDIRDTGMPEPMALPSASMSTDGALWVATEEANASGGRRVAVARSIDEGQHWTKLPPVPQTATGTATFTWVAAGSPGHVGVLYYYTPENGDPGSMANATWSAVWAESYDANTPQPTWTVHTVEENVHRGILCIAASCTGTARFAGDFISSYIDAGDNAHLSWMREDAGLATIRYQRVPARVLCDTPSVEDDGASLAYESGWHQMSDPSASAGHFRVNYGQENQHGVTLSLTVPKGQSGVVSYFYAQSPKGGTADIYLDDGAQPAATVSYKGGTAQNTARSPAFGFSKHLIGIAPGTHTLRVVPRGDGVSYVDGFCLRNVSTGGQPAPAGPGQTSLGTLSLSPGQASGTFMTAPAGAESLSVLSESSVALPYRLVLVDASGTVLKMADASQGGLAAVEAKVKPGGTYLLKTVNLGLGPLKVWTASTPYVVR